MAVALIALAAFQVISAGQQAELQVRAGELDNKIAEMNARFIEQDAFEAESLGLTRAARYQNVIDATISDQRLAFASEDVDVSTGTAAAIQRETKLIGTLNILDIQRSGRLKALGLRDQASNVRLGGQFRLAQSVSDAAGTRAAGIGRGIQTGISAYSRSVS